MGWVPSFPSYAGLFPSLFMKDHLFPCLFHVTSMAPWILTMSVPCHSLGWHFKEKVARMDRDRAAPSFPHSPSSSSFFSIFFLFFFLFLSFSSGFEEYFKLSYRTSSLGIRSGRISLVFGLDLLLDMTLLDQIEDRQTD